MSERMIELVGERRRFGYRRLHVLLEREGMKANHKRVFRLYQCAGLAVRKRRKRERVALERQPLLMPSGPNHTWSMDFVFDGLCSGRPIKCLTVVDDCTKECVEFEDLSYSEAADVMNCSPKAVETRLYRARQLLRSALQTLTPDQ